MVSNFVLPEHAAYYKYVKDSISQVFFFANTEQFLRSLFTENLALVLSVCACVYWLP